MSPVGGKITEKELRETLVRAAKEFGWRVYFTWSSMHSPKGFPDLCMVRPPRLIFAELKSDGGKTTPHQDAWLADLRELANHMSDPLCPHTPGPEVYVWRPADLEAAYRVLMS